MITFISVVLMILVFDVLVRLCKLATGSTYQVTLSSMAVDVVFDVGLIIWGVAVLCHA